METRLFKCMISERWMASLEVANISITTPKGTTLFIQKWPSANLKNKWTENDEVSILINKVYNVTRQGNNSIDLTRDEVMLWWKYSTKQDWDLTQKSKVTRGNIRQGTCYACGTKLRIRDYKTWVGYHCPKCGVGGTYMKNKNR